VPGLDFAAGLRRVLGRRDVYLSLLRTFTAGRARLPVEIRTALAEGRMADARRAAHSLKGEAGTIGASALQRQAGELEGAIRDTAGAAEVERLLSPVESTLGPLVAALLRILPPPEEPPPAAMEVDPAALRVKVAGLERLLAEDNVEAIKAFDEADALFSAAFGERTGEIRKLVKGYRFEEALRALREAAAVRAPL
jgi:two-component system sensor histidine kinase/response regulator